MNELIDRHGIRLVLECCADYCFAHHEIHVWAPMFALARDFAPPPKRPLKGNDERV